MKVKQLKVNGVPVPGAFEKESTEGDVYRFIAAESGHSEIIHRGDTRAGKVTAHLSASPPYYEFTLGFKYFVGLHQLHVALLSVGSGKATPLPNLADIEAARGAGWPTPSDLDPSSPSVQYFSEVSEDVVRVYNLGSADRIVWFSVPHTSLQAALSGKVIVNSQGDGVIMEGLGDGDGILLRSPLGRKGVLAIDDDLGLTVKPK